MSHTPAHDAHAAYTGLLCYKQTHLLCLHPPAHPLTCTCLHIPSQHLAWHLALLSLSEQFKWIIRLVMRRKWIVHLLISDQSPLSCSWCRIRLALCEMTPDSAQHCNTLWVPVKSGTSSPGSGPFSLRTADIFHITPPPPAPKCNTNATSLLSVPPVQMLICVIINKKRWCTRSVILPSCGVFLPLSSTSTLFSGH